MNNLWDDLTEFEGSNKKPSGSTATIPPGTEDSSIGKINYSGNNMLPSVQQIDSNKTNSGSVWDDLSGFENTAYGSKSNAGAKPIYNNTGQMAYYQNGKLTNKNGDVISSTYSAPTSPDTSNNSDDYPYSQADAEFEPNNPRPAGIGQYGTLTKALPRFDSHGAEGSWTIDPQKQKLYATVSKDSVLGSILKASDFIKNNPVTNAASKVGQGLITPMEKAYTSLTGNDLPKVESSSDLGKLLDFGGELTADAIYMKMLPEFEAGSLPARANNMINAGYKSGTVFGAQGYDPLLMAAYGAIAEPLMSPIFNYAKSVASKAIPAIPGATKGLYNLGSNALNEAGSYIFDGKSTPMPDHFTQNIKAAVDMLKNPVKYIGDAAKENKSPAPDVTKFRNAMRVNRVNAVPVDAIPVNPVNNIPNQGLSDEVLQLLKNKLDDGPKYKNPEATMQELKNSYTEPAASPLDDYDTYRHFMDSLTPEQLKHPFIRNYVNKLEQAWSDAKVAKRPQTIEDWKNAVSNTAPDEFGNVNPVSFKVNPEHVDIKNLDHVHHFIDANPNIADKAIQTIQGGDHYNFHFDHGYKQFIDKLTPEEMTELLQHNQKIHPKDIYGYFYDSIKQRAEKFNRINKGE